MVEILEKGNLKNYKIKCRHCESILKFTSLDETPEYIHEVPFEGEVTNWFIKCPCCNKNVPTRSITDNNHYDWREELQEEDKREELHDENNLEIKIPLKITCPNCGEHHYFYDSNDGKTKGILMTEYVFDGFFDNHYGHSYKCYSCGHKWDVRESEESLSVKLFPFLRNK